ncbi:ribosomal protein S5 domain protein [Wolffia australiana]
MIAARISSTFRIPSSADALCRSMAVSARAASVPSPYTTLKERVSCEREIKKSKFVAIAGHVADDVAAQSFLSQVRDPKATHNCWAYKFGDQYRCNDDGEPSGTAGKPIYSAICSSGLDMVMVVVIRYFGGIKLGTGGLVRAYGGVTSECLKDVPTCLIKPKIRVGLEVPFSQLGPVYHQLQSFQIEDIKQDYETGRDGYAMLMFNLDYDKLGGLETAMTENFRNEVTFYKN